ncbi:unnamed protein product [Caenorhabditis bovis]|uniref:C2H2-type domain-containing protein n=1 Tax=Caenorhabditis bovis TaxID=2654633 RepID=A0A8S1F7I0_9PELO|nr:unnamed protein product [Caenorhabditis bovis]
MSYHYQAANDFFDTSNNLPQVQMHNGYTDFYPADSSLMISQLPTQSAVIPSCSTLAPSIPVPLEATASYSWRADWNPNGAVTNWPINSNEPSSSSSATSTATVSNYRNIAQNQYYNEATPAMPIRPLASAKKMDQLQKPLTRFTAKPFKCHICCKAFSQAANLTAHKRIHTGEKPFLCSVCHRPFSQSSSLVTHKRTHTGERPYPCTQCEKAFTDSSTLTKHLRTHSGHKPYGCPLCMMRFTQSGNLHRHMKTHKRN